MYKERIQTLLEEAVKREPEYAPEDPDSTAMFIKERVDNMFEYTNYVVRMENHMKVLSVMGMSGQEYRDKVQEMDFGRRSKHECAIASVNQLNRLSENWGLEKFYDGPTDDEHRYQVGDLCGELCNEYFNGRAAQPMAVLDMMNGADLASSLDALAAEPAAPAL